MPTTGRVKEMGGTLKGNVGETGGPVKLVNIGTVSKLVLKKGEGLKGWRCVLKAAPLRRGGVVSL